MAGAVSRLLVALERACLLVPWHCDAPVLFVLGLPRSGTTLVSQVLVARARVAYLTNRVGEHPRAPVLVSAAQHRFAGRYVSDFRSDYGKVRGAAAPREAGAVWMRFFPRDDYVGAGDVRPETADALRRTIAATQCLFGGLPFVNKNVKHLLRVPALASILPRAHFLVVRRDERDVALSIWRARHKQQADPGAWWSVRPPEYAALRGLPVADQVVGQVVGLRDRLQRDLAQLAPERVSWLDYDAFCARPEELLDGLDEKGVALERVGNPAGPFEAVHHTPRDTAEREMLDRFPDGE
jgi:hypothetical protein